jgi:hypothetical protein
MSFVKDIADKTLREVANAFPLAHSPHYIYDPVNSYQSGAAAGAFLYSQDRGNFCLLQRGHAGDQSGTWGTAGGLLNPGESEADAIPRLLKSTIGYIGEIVALVPIYIYQRAAFTYETFAAVVREEFVPDLTPDITGFRWDKFGRWPDPLHYGWQAVMDDKTAYERVMQVDITYGL